MRYVWKRTREAMFHNTASHVKIKTYCKFNYLFLASTLFSLFTVGLFNILIDPYGFFNSPLFFNLNKQKPEKEKNFMLFKAADIRRIKPKIIFLGSSRVESGLNSKHPALANTGVIYNLGIQGTNMYEVMRYFQHTLDNQSEIEQVIIGLDFFMFNGNLENLDAFTETRLGKNIPLQDILNSSLSIDALWSSSRTITTNLNKLNDPYQEPTTSRFKRWLTNFLSFKGFYNSYYLSEERLNNLRVIIDTCHQRNIDVKLFISPTHATDYEAIRVAGLWLDFEQWKREIVNIVPVWDFSGYNSITTELISDNMKNHVDSSHYSPETGNLVLNRILSYQQETVPADFGILLTPKNIESHLAKIRTEQQIWAKNNSKEVKLVQDIKRELENKENNSK